VFANAPFGGYKQSGQGRELYVFYTNSGRKNIYNFLFFLLTFPGKNIWK
jgi:acyl-CoA reductase-like NAD-dependent aldehyde dehydrogenase